MKITRKELRNYLNKSILKEWVPNLISASPQVMTAAEEKLNRVSAKPSASGGYLFRFGDNQLGSGGPQDFTYTYKASETTDSPWQNAKEWWEGAASDYALVPSIFDIEELSPIKIPERLEETMESTLEDNVLWARSFFYLTKKMNEQKEENFSFKDGINFTVVGAFISDPEISDDIKITSRQVHTVILQEDVRKFARAVNQILRPPFYKADIARVRNILEFLSGDSNELGRIIGSNTTLFKSFTTKLKQLSNKKLKTKFDDNLFQRQYGTRLMCVSDKSDTSDIFDAVAYFNQYFSTISDPYPIINPTYDDGTFTDLVKSDQTSNFSPGNSISQVCINYNNEFSAEITAINNVLGVYNNLTFNRQNSGDKLAITFMELVKNNKEKIIDTTEMLNNLRTSAEKRGFDKQERATAIDAVSRNPLSINESFVQKRNKNLLLEALNQSQVDQIVADWLDKMAVAQNTGGLATEPAFDQSAKMMFFTSANGGDEPIKTLELQTETDTNTTVSSFFLDCLKEFKIVEVVQENIDGQLQKTLKIKSYEDIAFFIEFGDQKYLNPLGFNTYKVRITDDFKNLLLGYDVNSYQIADQTRVEGEQEEKERKPINCPDYSKDVKGIIRQMEEIVNGYLDSINATEAFNVDGNWVTSEDSAWEIMVRHALGEKGKSPAKGKVNVDKAAKDWGAASTELKNNGFPGYTPTAKGVLAFAYDAYTNGSNVECGWKRPLSSGRRSTGAPSQEKEETKSQEVQLPKKSASDLKIKFTGNLAQNKNITDIESDLRGAIVNALPTGKKIKSDTSLKINTRTGGGVQSFRSNLAGINKTGIEAQIRKLIKGPLGKNTKGTIDVTIPAGDYSMNESHVKELVNLIKELVKKQS